jgi:hypothetical protein
MSTAWGAAAEAVVDVLARENAALAVMDLRGAAALAGEKRRAVETFAAAARMAPVDPAGEADGDTGARLRRLRRLADENEALLRRGIAAQERVIGLVVDAIRDARAAAAGPDRRYTARGAAADGGGGAMALSARV